VESENPATRFTQIAVGAVYPFRTAGGVLARAYLVG